MRATSGRPYKGCAAKLGVSVFLLSTIPQSALLTAPFTQGSLFLLRFFTAFRMTGRMLAWLEGESRRFARFFVTPLL